MTKKTTTNKSKTKTKKHTYYMRDFWQRKKKPNEI